MYGIVSAWIQLLIVLRETRSNAAASPTLRICGLKLVESSAMTVLPVLATLRLIDRVRRLLHFGQSGQSGRNGYYPIGGPPPPGMAPIARGRALLAAAGHRTREQEWRRGARFRDRIGHRRVRQPRDMSLFESRAHAESQRSSRFSGLRRPRKRRNERLG